MTCAPQREVIERGGALKLCKLLTKSLIEQHKDKLNDIVPLHVQ
jgi:hypothetical protein